MPTATLTSKGQITVPKAVRDELHLRPGDTIDFVRDPAGAFYLRPGHVDVADLRGFLKRPGRKPVSLAAMDAAIQTARRGLP
jgi:antitoxin PrlF